jgi:uncharacterized protein YndB with AHSA1/START domain
MSPEAITIKAEVQADLERVWTCWTMPKHIMNWNFASEDWHCPHAKNDLKVGGSFCSTMASKDGSMSFDFEGRYTEVIPHKLIRYTLEDGREVKISFEKKGDAVKVTETFDPESENSKEFQEQGWQAILNQFKHYVESSY